MANFTIHPLQHTPAEVAILKDFCTALAAEDGYDAAIDPAKLQADLFQPHTQVRAFLARLEGMPIGFALVYECFTVYRGRRGLYMPGLYIVPEHRGHGHGKALLRFVARHALDNGFSFLNWLVEDGNARAQSFYQKIGASMAPGWQYCSLNETALRELGK